MGRELERANPGVLDTLRVSGAMRRASRSTALARIEAAEVAAIQAAKLSTVAEVTEAAVDEIGSLIDGARARGSQRDPAKAHCFGELVAGAQDEFAAIVHETGRMLRR